MATQRSLELPEGFVLIPDVVTPAEEGELLDFVERQPLAPFVYAETPSLRSVLNYGVNVDDAHKVPYLDDPVPEVFRPVLERTADALGVPVDRMVELLITSYPAGAGIGWHRDSRPFESVAALSLLADAPVKLRRAPTRRDPRTPISTVLVPRRSLYLLTGPARTQWMHHVPAVPEPRVSLTMRTVRPEWDIVGTAREDRTPLTFTR